MGKGLLILLVTFIVVAILHVVSIKMTRISEAKKLSFRKVFFYIYGIFLILSGILQCIEKDEIRIVFLIQSLCGLAFVILNFLGKMQQKTSYTSCCNGKLTSASR
jgi:cell division protein FtsW (lipid II flippase)